MEPALTCARSVRLTQQVSKRLHQVSRKQDEESFEPAGNVVGQPIERQQTLVTVGFPPVAELRTEKGTRI